MEQIRLDLIPDGSRPVCHVSQYDDGRVIRINLTENGADYTLSDETVELHVRKGDGTAVTCAVAIESGKKYVDIVTTTQMCAVYGSNLAELQITKNGAIIGTLNFILEVERDPLDSGISSSSQIHDLQAQVDACVQHTFDTLGASGLPFDHTGTDLVSDNVEDAIKEVNDKIGGVPSDVYTKEETDALLDEKADKAMLASDYYDKTEVDTALSGKADASALGNYYTKSEDDALLAGKADKSTTYTKSQVNGLLDDKADKSDLDDYYTSAQVDAALSAKADKSNVYTKAQVDSALSGKVDNATLDNYYDKSHSYSQTEVDGLLDAKADKATTYTKSQVDSALALKANSADVYTKTQTYSKTEVDTALALKANAADVYTKQETDNLIAGILPLKSFSATPLATLPDSANNVPMKSLSVNIVPKETGTGTKSPSNPYTISGTDEVVITHTGKNLFNKANGVLGYINSNGVIISANSNFSIEVYQKINAGQKVTLSANTNCQSLTIAFYDVKKSFLSRPSLSSTATLTGTASVDGYIRFGLNYDNANHTLEDWQTILDNIQIMLEVGDTRTTYEPYSATTHTIALGQTVYGGVCDVTGGNGTDKCKKYTFTEAQYYGTYGVDNANLYYVEIPNYSTEKIQDYADTTATDCILVSNMFVKTTGSNTARMGDNEFRTQAGATPRYFYFRADSFADLTAVNAFLAVTPLQVVAELQTPITLTGLTPTAIKTTGYDNVSADCGDVEGEYRQSIQGYVTDQLNGNRGLSKGPVEETKEEPEEKPEER